MTCPIDGCDAELQATTKLYWTLGRDGWEIVDVSNEEIHFYCEEDHEELDVPHEVYRDLQQVIEAMTDGDRPLVDPASMDDIHIRQGRPIQERS